MAKGTKTGGGSRKGIPNKTTAEIGQRIREKFGNDFDPVMAMAELARDEVEALQNGARLADLMDKLSSGSASATDVVQAVKTYSASKDFAMKALSEVAQYVHPKRKAIEHSSDPLNPLRQRIEIAFVVPKALPAIEG